jgi:ankyrin repeat protein
MNIRSLLSRFFHFPICLLATVTLVVLVWSSLAFCGEIHDAVKAGDLAKVKALLKEDPNLVFSEDSGGYTSLHWAAYKGHKNVAELLLAHKSDVNAKDHNGNTPLHEAAYFSHKDVADLLLAHNADVNARNNDGDTPLLTACRLGHKDAVEFLLVRKADVNAKNISGETPLHRIAAEGQKDVMELLLANGADANAKENGGTTPMQLVLARKNDRKEMKALLLAHGAEINIKPEAYCPAGDPHVRIRAEIKDVESNWRDKYKDSIQFRMHARVRITNVSSDPILLLGVWLRNDSKYPYPRYGEVKIARTEAQASSCRYIYSKGSAGSSVLRSPYYEDIRKALDHETPPEDAIHKIEPNGHWEFDIDIDFSIWNGDFLLSGEGLNSLEEILSDPHVWLQINLKMWPSHLEAYGSILPLGLSLQEKWRPYGHLLIEDQKTDPVELTLPLN